MHPAALNLTHSLTTVPELGQPSSENPAHSHAHQHLALSPGVLSPALDSIRIQWGSNGGHSHDNVERHKDEKLGHQSLKGTQNLMYHTAENFHWTKISSFLMLHVDMQAY